MQSFYLKYSTIIQTAAANPAFDFLKDPKEDIYTLSDGRPFDDGHDCTYQAGIGRIIGPNAG